MLNSSRNEANRMPDSRPPLGRLLRTARAARGLTQLDLARELGVSMWRVSRLERGVQTASPRELHRLALYLALPSFTELEGRDA